MVSHIHVEHLARDRKISVLFSFCAADYKKENLNFVGSIFTLVHNPNVVLYHDQSCITTTNFHRLFAMDRQTYVDKIKEIEEKVRVLEK